MDLLPRKKEILDRIYVRCKRDGECLRWKGKLIGDGYGQISINSKDRLVHRLVLILESEQEGECALHAPIICHNRDCCEIKHLRWGTAKENYDDKKLDGTLLPPPKKPKGQNHHNSKLTDVIAREIYLNTSDNTITLAKKYNLSKRTINRVKTGKYWNYVTKDLDLDIPIEYDLHALW